MSRPSRPPAPFRVSHRIAETVAPPRAPELATARGRNKPHYSRWLITINPNQSMGKVHDPQLYSAFQGRFLEWMGCLFPEDVRSPNWTEIMYVAPKGVSSGDSDEDIPYLITDVNSVTAVEVGAVQHRIHMHALLEVEHWSWLRMSYIKINEIIQRCAREMPMPGQNRAGRSGRKVYVNVKYVGSSRPVVNYVLKGSTGTGQVFEHAPAHVTALDWERLEKIPARDAKKHNWVMGPTGPRTVPSRKQREKDEL